MLTFCRLAASRAGILMRRRHHLLRSSSSASSDPSSSPSDHDYLALNLPDPPQLPPRPFPPSTDPSATPGTASADPAASVDELAARLQRRRRGRPGQEAVIAASFGVIRLDSDNRPVVHGQFEPGLYGDGEGERNPELAEAMAERQTPGRPSSSAWKDSYHDDHIDNNNINVANDRNSGNSSLGSSGSRNADGSPMSRSEWERQDLDVHPGDLRHPGATAAAASVAGTATSGALVTGANKGDPAASDTTAPYLAPGYVDDQYFPDLLTDKHPLIDDDAAAREPASVLPSRLDAPPADVFDEQYFAAAFEPEPAAAVAGLPVSSPLRGADLARNVDRAKADGDGGSGGEGGASSGGVLDGGSRAGKLEGRPEGVFEEQDFWAAFEDMDEQREVEAYKAGLAAKYSRIGDGQSVAEADGVTGEGEGRHQNMPETVDRRDAGGRDQSVRQDARTGRDVPLGEDFEVDLSMPAAAASSRPSQSPPPSSSPSSSQPSKSAQSSQPPSSKQKKTDATPTSPSGRRSALEVVREMRAAATAARPETANRGRQLRAELTDLSALPSSGVLSILRRGVLHDAEDFVVLYKPPGLSVHSATERHPHCLTELLPSLAKHLHCDQLLTVHRLDRDTSGALLLAKTPDAAGRISGLLREGRVLKTYWAVVRGEPDLPSGVVDIPVMLTVVGGRERMGLPSAGGGDIPPGAQRAVTRYRVLSRGSGCSLLELSPATGAKHQLRVHLGLGLACPVLGDHKYSRWETVSRPQRLPPTSLAALGLRAPEARHLPLHLHARALWLPGLQRRVTAPLPLYFKRNMRRLKMAAGKVKADGSNYGKDE